MIEETVQIATPDGAMPTFITRPESGGPHPAVIIYMDAPGFREELCDFARRIATVGYYCMLPNLYYRDGGLNFRQASERSEEENLRMAALMNSLTNQRIVEDTRPLLAHSDNDPGARPGPMGCIGYCMSGQFVLTLAGTFPERFQATVALHGVRMWTDQPDSPHTLIPRLQGGQYFGFAENDHLVPLNVVDDLKSELERHGAQSLVEVHPGCEHGFVFPQRAVFNKHEAERAWERTFALFDRHLRG